MILFGVLLLFLVLGFLIFERGLLLPRRYGLKVLMYHRLHVPAKKHETDNLSTSVDVFERQLQWLLDTGERPYRLSELLSCGGQYPEQGFIITFDDGYRDNLELALPVLQRLKVPAAIFLVSEWIERASLQGNQRYLSVADLRVLADSGWVEFGLHSHSHRSYRELMEREPQALMRDLRSNQKYLSDRGIPFLPVLAYPYGAIPRTSLHLMEEMFRILRACGIELAFRIGNRVNSGSISQCFSVQRIDIKGSDSFGVFKIKMRKGRSKVFA